MSDRGSIEVGKKANLFVYSLMDNQVDDFHGFTDYSIYYGLDRLGRVIHTIKDGKFIVRNMQFQSQKGNKI
jgi:dihydroorotase-like cyclic amidohydrolase